MSRARRVSIGAIAAILVAVFPGIGEAAVTSAISGSTLTVTGDRADNAISINCIGGLVKIGGAVPGVWNDPGTGAASCDSITNLTIDGRGGSDYLTAILVSTGAFPSLSDGAVTIIGGTGDDIISGTAVGDILSGGADNDHLVGMAGDDSVAGGTGTDTVGPGLSDHPLITLSNTQLITATTGTDSLSSVERASLAVWNGTIDASAFSGDTTQEGGTGADTMIGGSGRDVFYPGTGANTITGGGGGDEFHQKLDSLGDSLTGGTGFDTVIAGGAELLLSDTTLQSSTGIDTLAGIDRAELQADASSWIDAGGFTGTTVLIGAPGAETIRGGSGPDAIDGKNGNDMLYGRAGDDTINGGNGVDTCNGGLGADTITACE